MEMKKLMCMLLALLIAAGSFGAFADGEAAKVFQSYTTLYASSDAKIYNVELAAERLNGYVLEKGEVFSFNEIIGPRTQEYGYKVAENGRGVKVRGGGAAQLATTVYYAVMDAGINAFHELHFYGDKFADNYAASGDMAVLVDYASETDFVFYNYLGDMTFYAEVINGWLSCKIVLGDAESVGGSIFQGAMVGSATTAFASDKNQKTNALLAAGSISGITLTYGQTFSFNTIVGPRTQEAGYKLAVNGRGAKVRGGGSAQAASTLYLAVKNLPNVYMVEKHTYGDRYNQTYVTFPEDAIMVDYSGAKDFRFTYYGNKALTIYMYEVSGILYCNVYER